MRNKINFLKLDFRILRSFNRRNIVLFAFALKPIYRRLILIFLDICSLVVSLIFAFWLQTQSMDLNSLKFFIHKFFPLSFALPLYIFSRTNVSLSKYAGSTSFYLLGIRNLVVVCFGILLGSLFQNILSL